jgi:crotonobetainyl-CoA:carnitine CoA-transferase CaiB-like acyl-CoA transferase
VSFLRHDINYIAPGGLLDVTGAIPGSQIAGLAGGSLQAVIGKWLMALPLAVYSAMGETPTMLSGRYACYQTYQAEDGRWLAAGALEPKFWASAANSAVRNSYRTNFAKENGRWRSLNPCGEFSGQSPQPNGGNYSTAANCA